MDNKLIKEVVDYIVMRCPIDLDLVFEDRLNCEETDCLECWRLSLKRKFDLEEELELGNKTYKCPSCKEDSLISEWDLVGVEYYESPYTSIESEDVFCSYICPKCNLEVDMDDIISVTYEEDEE